MRMMVLSPSCFLLTPLLVAVLSTNLHSFCDGFSVGRPTANHPGIILPRRSRGQDTRHQSIERGCSTTELSMVLGLPDSIVLGGGLIAAFVGWLYVDGADDRARKGLRREEEARYEAYMNERAQKAYIEPKEFWTEEELRPFDGSQDNEEGPILMAADGLVFNVYKGRNFYGPGGEYHLFAGRDATRLLARTRVEEESPEEIAKPLTIAERASLAAWMFTFKGKYEIVGKLKDFDPSATSM